ncbi:hypothetical protein GALL_134280 [mine drainage metagenome]|uniref:DUF2914 domain-containing protein n=1 Tax=mine drainage metagenome TaxID=410659 RepID=A0A1J5SWV4_9ZZZZ
MLIVKLQQSRWYQHILRLKDFFPVLAFFGGFLWDALTIGKRIAASDLWMLSAYLLAVIPIIWWLVRKENQEIAIQAQESLAESESTIETSFESASQPAAAIEAGESHEEHWTTRLPYMAIQFLFGSLFSALFILYFKSSSHITAIIWSIGLGALLVANEYLEEAYKRLTLTWTLFGFCAILLFNFVVPFVVGSIHAIWFFASTLLAVAATCALKLKISPQLGSIKPTYIVAAVIILAYVLDVIPPVPLVKRDVQVGTHFEKLAGEYRVLQDKAPWWVFWSSTSNTLYINAGDPVYCISSVFAPRGLETKLYHNWQYYDAKKGWQTRSRIGFSLAGGRDNGFRGYTFKQNLAYGEWRVKVETEGGKTIAVHKFDIEESMATPSEVLSTGIL